MDDETQTALQLTKSDLLAMRDAGEPGVVAKRPRDLNRLAKAIVGEAVGEPERPVRTIYLRPVRGNHPNVVGVKRMA